jgi:uncharacterized coiled-coil protein SlyX
MEPIPEEGGIPYRENCMNYQYTDKCRREEERRHKMEKIQSMRKQAAEQENHIEKISDEVSRVIEASQPKDNTDYKEKYFEILVRFRSLCMSFDSYKDKVSQTLELEKESLRDVLDHHIAASKTEIQTRDQLIADLKSVLEEQKALIEQQKQSLADNEEALSIAHSISGKQEALIDTLSQSGINTLKRKTEKTKAKLDIIKTKYKTPLKSLARVKSKVDTGIKKK